MAKTSIRLSPEICKKLTSEVRRLGEIGGETVTVSELKNRHDLFAPAVRPGRAPKDLGMEIEK